MGTEPAFCGQTNQNVVKSYKMLQQSLKADIFGLSSRIYTHLPRGPTNDMPVLP